jgi:hypothetical protein
VRNNSLRLYRTCHLSSAITPGNTPLFSPSGIGYALKSSGDPGALRPSSSDVEVFSYYHIFSLAACILEVPRWRFPFPSFPYLIPWIPQNGAFRPLGHVHGSRSPRFARRSPAFPRTHYNDVEEILDFLLVSAGYLVLINSSHPPNKLAFKGYRDVVNTDHKQQTDR